MHETRIKPQPMVVARHRKAIYKVVVAANEMVTQQVGTLGATRSSLGIMLMVVPDLALKIILINRESPGRREEPMNANLPLIHPCPKPSLPHSETQK